VSTYNFGASKSILTKLFLGDLLRGSGDKMGKMGFWKARPLKFGRAKKRPKFGAISADFQI